MANKTSTDGRTTIVTAQVLLDRVSEYCEKQHISQTDFITKAILNEFERRGDFEIRDIYEEARAKDGKGFDD